MGSPVERRRLAKRLWRPGLLITILLAAISTSQSSVNSTLHPSVGSDPLRNWRLQRADKSESDIEKYATAEVQPAYPETAQKYRIEGIVKVQVAVNRDGKVTRASFIKGHTVFRSASLDAARQWQFKSPDDNDMEGTITFVFKLKS